jgi:hypothetical protein
MLSHSAIFNGYFEHRRKSIKQDLLDLFSVSGFRPGGMKLKKELTPFCLSSGKTEDIFLVYPVNPVEKDSLRAFCPAVVACSRRRMRALR